MASSADPLDAGGGWPDHFYAGGRVCGTSDRPTHVRLRANNGVVLEDVATAGTVLLLNRQDQPLEAPMTIELHGSGGALLAVQSFADDIPERRR